MTRIRLVAALLFFCAIHILAASGGPDASGYRWRDTASGASYSWIDISGTGTNLALTDDLLSSAQNLGFTFTYYGTAYTQCKVSSNGWVTLNTSETVSAAGNVAIPTAAVPNALVAGYWDDLNPAAAGAGDVYFQAFPTYVVIQWQTIPRYLTSDYKTFEIVIYQDGRVKVQYQDAGSSNTSCTVGIENAAGTVGLQCLFDGTPSGGFALGNAYAVEFFQATPSLNCTGAASVSCDSTLAAQAMGAANNATAYGCSASTFNGRERVYQLVLASAQNLDVTISNFAPDNLAVFLLSACDEYLCLAGGSASLSYDRAPAGTYYIVVDGLALSDDGPFDLQVKCNPPSTVDCSGCALQETFEGCSLPSGWTTEVIAGNAWGVVNDPSLACAGSNCTLRYPTSASNANSWVFTRSLALQAGTTYVLAFDWRVGDAAKTEKMDIYIGAAQNSGGMTTLLWDNNSLTSTTCTAEQVTFTVPSNGTYYIGFHCYSGKNKDRLAVDNVSVCPQAPAYDCSSATAIPCPYSATASTAGGPSTFSGYACSEDSFLGREKIYTLTFASPYQVTATLSNYGARDMGIFLLSACDPCTCIAGGGASLVATVAAGTYYLVVDGFTPSDDGVFDLSVACVDACLALSAVTCNATVTSTTVGKGNDLHDPGLTCVGGGAGPDEAFRLDYVGPAGSTLWAEAAPSGGWDHILYALSNCVDVASCLAGADTGAISFDTTVVNQTAFFVVDGYSAGSQGAYDLTVRCFTNQLNCGSAEPLSCYSAISVNTASAPQNVYKYGCAASGAHPGPERVYSITTPSVGTLTATLSGLSGDDLDVFILDGTCSPGACLAWGETTATYAAAPAGTYYIVVDTDKFDGSGTATLTVTCPLGNSLVCGSATDISCNSEFDGDTATGAASQNRYSCGVRDLQGKEKIYRITLASPRTLRATLSSTGGRDLDVVLLSSCDPNACLAQGDTEILYSAAAGTYYLVVDGLNTLDDGPFHLELLCLEASSLGCSSTLINETFEGANPPWTTEVISGNPWDFHTDASYSCGGSDFLRYPFHLTEAAISWVFTDALAMSSSSAYTLQFDWRVASATFPESFSVWIGTAPNSASMTTKLWEVIDSTSTSCSTATVPFTVPSSGNYYLGFRCTSDADMFWVTVDDILLTGTGGGTNPVCGGAASISCGVPLSGQAMGASNTANQYSCSPYRFNGRERVYTFDLSETRTVTATLSNYGSYDLALFLLRGCDVCQCVAGGGTSLNAFALAPGTYYLVVEGYDSSDDSAVFDIAIACSDPCLGIPLISCGVPVSGDTTPGSNLMVPSCGAGAGPEDMYKLFFSGPVGSILTVSMPSPVWDHVLYALADCVTPSSCGTWADSGNLTLTTTTSPQTYYIVVDGYSSSAKGAYSNLLVTCPLPSNINCAAATPIACGATAAGDTIGTTNNASEYANVNGTFTGGEIVYALTIAAPKNLDIYLEGHTGRRMYLFLLERNVCNVNNVIEGGVGEIHLDNAQAGTYYIIVDGRTPADNGAFSLRIVCNDPATAPDCTFVYTVTEPAAYSWVDATGGTALTMNDDTNSGFLPLPFPFSYYETIYNQVAVCSNGWASFTDGTSTAYANASIPLTAAPNALLAAFWDDLDPSLAGTVFYQSFGSSPNRTFVIQWDGVRHHTTTDTYTFEIVLSETSNQILFQYQAMGSAASATIGIESKDGTGGYERYENGVPAPPALASYAIRFNPAGPATSPDCSAPTVISCGVPLAGNTAGAGLSNDVTAYSCGVDTYQGNEQVFVLTLASRTMVDLLLSNFGARELDAFILSACSQCACVAGGSDSFTTGLDPGTYYIVVDGFTAADNGTFDLSLTCAPCTDAGAHSRWTSCENPRSPITASTTSAFEWFFDDCDYCRDGGNTCFSTPCTFDMYIVAECGSEMHMPLYDNETGRLKIYDLTRSQYVPLFAQSTGGWSSSGTEISWQDCGGVDPLWNDQTTDVWFYGSPTLCGIYRAEFVDWGGFVWDLYSNCSGSNEPGFKIYDNYCEALAAYQPFPSLSVESISITGTCPTYTVNYQISNAGCAAAGTTIVAESNLGGSTEKQENNILPGETRSGSLVLNVQSGGSGTIVAYADFYDTVFECQEAGDTAAACSLSGGSASASAAVNCNCIIPQFSTAQVEDLNCPVGLRIFWNAATFNSGAGHYDIYRSTASFADAVASPPIASSIAVLEYLDNAVTPGSTYYYVIRAEDNQAAVPPCTAGGHGGMRTDVNVGPIVDNLTFNANKPYDIGNDLRGRRNPDSSAHLEWPTVTPHANTTHWHVYRSTSASATFPDGWQMICPDKPNAGWLQPYTLQYDDATASGALYFYDVRSANDCEDICPAVLNVGFTSTTPSCDGTGVISFASAVQGGLGPYFYDWDFGDGTAHSSLANPSHAYTFPPYTRAVTLTVTDSTQPTNQVEARVIPVFFGPPVTASFTYSAAGLMVTFDGTGGGGSGAFTFSWTFGDNTSSSLEDPSHTYSAPGTYSVTLAVTDSNSGCRSTTTQSVTL